MEVQAAAPARLRSLGLVDAKSSNNARYPRSDEVKGVSGRSHSSTGCWLKARNSHGRFAGTGEKLRNEEDGEVPQLAAA